MKILQSNCEPLNNPFQGYFLLIQNTDNHTIRYLKKC